MTENELRQSFENLTLRADQFSHYEHVRLAWSYLSAHPLLDVLRIFPENLKRFAASIGVPGLYHETITWSYLMLIAERMQRSGERAWTPFIDENPDLLERGLLMNYYDETTLGSEKARRTFVFPRPSK